MNISELLRDGAASTRMLAELQGDSNHVKDAELMEAAADELELQEASRSPGCYPAVSRTEYAARILDSHGMLEEAGRLRIVTNGCQCGDCNEQAG